MLLKFVRSLFGLTVSEQGDFIVVKGLPADFLNTDIEKLWQTSKIGKFMFNRLSGSQMVFHKFFAPDVLYTLEQVLNKKRARTNKRAVEKIIQALKENTWLKRLQEEQKPILNFDNLDRLNVSPLGHQKEFLNTYNTIVPKYNLNGYMLGAAPGSGKTIAGLMLGECLDADQILCCVPKNAVKDVWEKTVSGVYKKPQKFWTSMTGGPPPEGTRIFIFHYETLGAMLEYARNRSWGKTLVILDESHNFNDMSSNRTKAFIELCLNGVKSSNVVWASGTPIKAIGKEAIPFLMTVDPLFKGPVIERFSMIFGKTATRALDILKARIGYMTFTIDKQQIVNNKVETNTVKVTLKNGDEFTLPVIREKMNKYIKERMKYYKVNFKDYVKKYEEALSYFEKTNRNGQVSAQLKEYRKYAAMIHKGYDPETMKDLVIFCNNFENKFIIPALPQPMKNEFKNARSVYKYYDLKVQGEALGNVLGRERTRCNVEIARASENMQLEKPLDGSTDIGVSNIIDFAEKKTVIFTSYIEVVTEMSKRLSDIGFSPLEVYGETNKNLPAIVKNFGENLDANPLVATYQSLSTAVPLVMANNIITMNYPFRAHEYEQAISRCDRIGQTETVRVWNVVLDTGGTPNISTRSAEIMQWSKEQIAAIMGRKVINGPEIAVEGFWDENGGGPMARISLEEIFEDKLGYKSPLKDVVVDEIIQEDLQEELYGDHKEIPYHKGLNVQHTTNRPFLRSPTQAIKTVGDSKDLQPHVRLTSSW